VLESIFATLVSCFVLVLVRADDNAGETGMTEECKVNMFGERGRAQNRRRQPNEHTQWMPFWLTLRPLQFYLPR